MERPLKISVIIPVFNEEHHIGACLDALMAQTVPADEIIVVDNNSADDSVAITTQYSGVKIVSEEQQGLYYARQTGMRVAQGDILCRIDADTQLSPGWVAAVRQVFADDAVQAASGPVGYYDFYLPRMWLWLNNFFGRGAILMNYKFLFGCNMAIRRNAWQVVERELCNKPFLLEDIDVTLHLRDHGIDPVYSKHVYGFVSCRRALDSLPQFWDYMSKHARTMRYHGRPVFAAYYAECVYMIFYLIFHPWVVMYNPATGRLEPSRLWNPVEARPDPMTTGIGLPSTDDSASSRVTTD